MAKAKKETSIIRSFAAEYLTLVAGSDRSDVNAVYADENVWLSQKMIALLYDVNVRTVNEHLKNILADSALEETSVIQNFRITASDGKSYDTKHYNMSAISAVGYKVNSERVMQDWELRLNKFIEATDREVLQDAGRVSAEIAKAHAESEFEKFRIVQDRLFESDFDRAVQGIEASEKKGKK
jgi:hypothetical protein